MTEHAETRETVEQLAERIRRGVKYKGWDRASVARAIQGYIADHEGHVVRDGRLVPLGEKATVISLSMSLEDAKRLNVCRICGGQYSLPWQLSYGEEYAHVACVEKVKQQSAEQVAARLTGQDNPATSDPPQSPYSREEVAEALKRLQAEGKRLQSEDARLAGCYDGFWYVSASNPKAETTSGDEELLQSEVARLGVVEKVSWSKAYDIIARAHNLPTLAEQESEAEQRVGPSREWLEKMADAEDRCESVSVGTAPAEPVVTDADRKLAISVLRCAEHWGVLTPEAQYGEWPIEKIARTIARSRHDERQRWEAEREKLQADRVEAWLERDALQKRLDFAETQLAKINEAAVNWLYKNPTPAASAERSE